MKLEKSERSLNWLLSRIFGFLTLNFSYDTREFWWGDEDILDKNQNIRFRLLKIWIANFIALVIIGLIPIILGVLYNFSDFIIMLKLYFVTLSCISFFKALFDTVSA